MDFGLPSVTKSPDVLASSTSATTSTSTTTIRTDRMDETTLRPEIPHSNDSILYLFVPMAVLVTVIFLSGMVYLMARMKRKVVTRIYNQFKMPSDYTMLDASDFEHDDDADNEDDPNQCLLRGKLQVEHKYDSYPIQSYSCSQRELYT